MKKLITTLFLSIIAISIAFGNKNDTITLKGNQNLDKYVIGKTISDEFEIFCENEHDDYYSLSSLSALDFGENKYLKLACNTAEMKKQQLNYSVFENLFGDGIFLDNLYFLNTKGEISGKIKERLLKKLNEPRGIFHKGEIVIFEVSGLEENQDFEKKYLGKNIIISKHRSWIDDYENIYENAYKLTCKDNKIYAKNPNDYLIGSYTGTFENSIGIIKENIKEFDELKIEDIENYLNSRFSSCSDFYNFFGGYEYNYKNNLNYQSKKDKYKKLLKQKFNEKISILDYDKKISILRKVRILRDKINNSDSEANKKDDFNIILDALIELITNISI